MTETHTTNDLDQKLRQLVAEACAHPAKSLMRRQKLNEVVRLVTQSDKLWRQNTPHYKDALQQTWFYFCRNVDQYDPTQCSVITWLNNSLKWRLQDFCKAEVENRARTIASSGSDNGYIDRLMSNLPASPEIPSILEETYQWVQIDPDNELRKIHIKGYPHVTCQALILLRLPPEVSWKEIAQKFSLPLSTAPNFCWNSAMRLYMDAADLKLIDIGSLECRPVESETFCHLPLEVPDERIGIVVVRIDLENQEAGLLGFTKTVKPGKLALKQLQPLDELLKHLDKYLDCQQNQINFSQMSLT